VSQRESEGNVGGAAAGISTTLWLPGLRLGRGSGRRRRCGLRAAAQELKGVGIHLGHRVLDGVAVFPGARAQLALDIELGAATNVALGNLGVLAPHHDAVPLGALGHLLPAGSGIGPLGGGQ